MEKPEKITSSNVPDKCPHCGNKLSPWQQVLLATDRVLVCKNCWYRIVLEVFDKKNDPSSNGQQEEKE